MFEGNPVYNTVPTTAPGIEGLRYMLGDVVASVTGGVSRPYVPPNQSTFDATLAKHVSAPLYGTMMANVYRQMGYQLGNTAGAMPLFQHIGGMAGVSPEEMRRAMSGGGAAFGRSFIGQMVMPLLDSGMASIGLTGGSMVAAANSVFAQRMSLLSPGTQLNPFNAGMQHQAMGAASAVASMLNGMMSQTTADGHLSLLANTAVTQGFDRQRIAQLAMKAAGRGAFMSYASGGLEGAPVGYAGNLADRLSSAIDGMDLALLDYTAGDFTGGGKDSVLDHNTAQKVKTIQREFAHRMDGITKAMAAMRDLTKEVDGLEEKLDNLTNGEWLRSGSGGFAAHNALRALHAVTAMHNIDPNAALSQIVSNRSVLQAATGFDPSMQAFGFNGGGMFGLAAQTELFTNIEEMITARGVRGDPILAGRLRMQGVQAMARNMNTRAGRGAQVLAYARQMGIISDADAREFQDALASGDRGIMGSTLNRLLVTVFGSAEAGRRFMNDQMQMNSMRQAMNDDAGVFAMQTTVRGADAEFSRRGQIVAAERRLAFTRQVMSDAGMRTWQSDADISRLTESVAKAIQQATAGPDGQPTTDGIQHATAFREQVAARIAGGASPRAAFAATQAAFARNEATSAYSEVISHAVTRQSAVNNEAALGAAGRESYQANAGLRALRDAGLLSGQDGRDIATLLRDGLGAEALSKVNGVINGLSASQSAMFRDTLKIAGSKYDAAKRTMEDNAAAETLIAKANAGQFSSSDAAQAYTEVVDAARFYFKNKDTAQGYDDFWEKYSKSKFALIFGEDEQKKVFDAIERGDTGFFKTMGRQATAMRQVSVGNLQDSGYGLEMSGFWGGGSYSGNSPAALKERNDMITQIASAFSEDSALSPEDRTSLAQDVMSFFTGNSDWRRLLKMYDVDDALTSRVKKFGAAFSSWEKAQAASGDLVGGYRDAVGRIFKNKGGAPVSELTSLMRNGIKEQGDLDNISKFLKDNDISGDDADAILGYAGSLLTVSEKHAAVGKAIAEDIKGDSGFADAFKSAKRRADAGLSEGAKLASDSGIQAYFDEVDLDGTEKAFFTWGDKGKKAFNALFDLVSKEDAAKSLGLSTPEGMSQGEYAKAAFKIAKERAAKGHSEEAVETMRLFKAASNEGVTRIRGELIIKSGNDQSPAVLEGNVGGLG